MSTQNQTDPFEDLFSLEDQYYQEGYQLGVADGARSGRIEGRVFGLEKGFEKFAAMGALAGQCVVWEARMEKLDPTSNEATSGSIVQVPIIPQSTRLQKHLQTLSALTEIDSLSTENNEDAVTDFDDRLKRAEGKTKVVQSILGETVATPSFSETSNGAKRTTRKTDSGMEDFTVPKALRQP